MINNKISVMPLFILALCLSLPVSAKKDFNATPVLSQSKTITGQPLNYSKTQSPEVSSVIVDIQPGGESGLHKHPVSPHIYVIEGVVTIEFEHGDRKVFSAGEAFLEAVDTWHNARNLGNVPVKMLVVFFGEQGKKNMIFP